MNALKKSSKLEYLDEGQGQALILLHGLLGTLSNFKHTIDFFSKKSYRVIMPMLPVYSSPLIRTGIRSISKSVIEFIQEIGLRDSILMGNSLGGHIALLLARDHPEYFKGMVIAGSSGLYESSMGASYPKRNNYEYITRKTQEVFYDPEIATKELIDEVYKVSSNRIKVLKTIAVAKTAVRHNMAKDLHSMKTPTCIIWGKQDIVTPPSVAEEFHSLLPDSDLFWVDKCGHVPMMEQPQEFNKILSGWFDSRGF